MPALPSLDVVQISGTAVLEMNSEILPKTFTVFPFSTFSKLVSEYGYP